MYKLISVFFLSITTLHAMDTRIVMPVPKKSLNTVSFLEQSASDKNKDDLNKIHEELRTLQTPQYVQIIKKHRSLWQQTIVKQGQKNSTVYATGTHE